MLFNLNDFLRSISNALDVIEADIFGVATNHSKRIAYISLKIAIEFKLSDKEIFDLVSYSILHDNGASLKVLHDCLRGSTNEKLSLIESMKEHCLIGEENVSHYPFLNSRQGIIKYHHEKYDGTGFFGLAGDEIPIMSQIISFSDTLDLNFDLRNVVKGSQTEERIIDFVQQHRNKYFSSQAVDAFFRAIEKASFWGGLSDQAVDVELKKYTPHYTSEFTYEQIRTVTKTFSQIIDAKSRFTQQHSGGLADKLERMTVFYGINQMNAIKLLIAADLHDLGKLAVSNNILDKAGSLTKEEFEQIKKHPLVTASCLQEIKGFEDIAEWACNHHEKLNGTGYPRGLRSDQLDFFSRLLACLDIYQALREERPYRKPMHHPEAMTILKQMAEVRLIDSAIVKDIDINFAEDKA